MENVNLKQTLAENVKREMSARKLTPTELAKRCGWRLPRVSEILRADHSPTLDTVEVIATALEIQPSSLLMPLPENSFPALLTG